MKIKVPFYIATTDLKGYEQKDLNVEMKIGDDMRASENIEYSMVIPDHMFQELADSEPQFKTTYDVNNHNISGMFSQRSGARKFQKTQTSLLIKQLQDYIFHLIKMESQLKVSRVDIQLLIGQKSVRLFVRRYRTHLLKLIRNWKTSLKILIIIKWTH